MMNNSQKSGEQSIFAQLISVFRLSRPNKCKQSTIGSWSREDLSSPALGRETICENKSEEEEKALFKRMIN